MFGANLTYTYVCVILFSVSYLNWVTALKGSLGVPNNTPKKDMELLATLSLLGTILFLFGCIVLWGGKCEKCKSWRNWRNVSTSFDDHRPNLIFTTHTNVCSKCGHRVQTGTTIKEKDNSLH